MTPTPPDVQSIFGRALEVESPAGRAAFLDEACGGDACLRAEIEGLLATLGRAGEFLRRPAAVAAGLTGSYDPLSEGPGTRVGAYKLLQQIGEGGMGVVYMAEQQEPVRRKVALKIIKPGMDSKQVIARFEAERQALAMMDHQNIAKVFDAGTTETGRPYFVMELVHGVAITDYCDANKLTPRQRLELFVPVCHAVQHAHQKGVIHRDLKPSNILVTMYDDRPVPKVIDFGVAKAVEQRLTEKTLFTQFGTLVGTFEYMSPEQAEMNAFGVDTRSDVYSLGVLLYELLTGTTPLERKKLREAALGEVVRLIKEEEPPRPSVRLSTSGALAKVAAARQTDPAKLSRLVRGELDWVVMRCLEKDRTRRYETANGLARDVERYLHDEPVEACPPSAGYRLRKFSRKYKKALAVAAAFASLLLVGLALVTWKWQDERKARGEADAARREAEEKAQEIREGVDRVNAANAAMELGAWYEGFGLWAAAEAEYTRAIGLRGKHSQAWLRRGDLYARLGLRDLVVADYAQAFELREPDATTPWHRHALGLLTKGDEAGYRRVCRDMLDRFAPALDRLHRSGEPRANDLLRYTSTGLARACSLAPGALPDYERLLRLVNKPTLAGGSTWVPLSFRGRACYRAGRHEEAIRWIREALSQGRGASNGLNYPVLAMALHRLGQTDAARHELENARATVEQLTETVFVNPGLFLPNMIWADWEECQLLYREACRLIDNTSPPQDARLLVVRGRAFHSLGRQEEAARAYAEATRLAPADHRVRLRCFRHHVSQGRWDHADLELAAVVKLRPADPEVHLYAFRAYADHGHDDRAAAAHAEAVGLSPDDVKVRLERFRHYAERQATAEADKALAEVAAHRPDDAAFQARCGDQLAEYGRWANARDAYARAIAAGAKDGQVWLRHALLQLFLGDEKGYRQTYAALVERHGKDASPGAAQWLLMTGCLAPDNGVDPKRLLEFVQTWAREDADEAKRWRGVALFRAGKYDEALDELSNRKALGDRMQHRVVQAMALFRKGQVDEADRLMYAVQPTFRQLNPRDTSRYQRWDFLLERQLYYREGEALIQSQLGPEIGNQLSRRQWAEVVRLIDKARTTRPDSKHAFRWVTYGNCLAEVGRWKDAAAAFARAVELAPDYEEATRALATIHLHLGDQDAYRQLCARLVERRAKATDAGPLNQAAQVCVYVPDSGVDPAEVVRLATKAVEAGPDQPFYRRTLGRALHRAGRHADAVRELQTTMRLAKGEGLAKDWLFLAMAHARLGNADQARKYLAQSAAWMDRHLKSGEPLPGSATPFVWEELEQLTLFRREAEALLR